MGIESAIGGAIGLGSALIGSSAAKKAGKTQAKAADRAAQLQQGQYEQTREDQMPFLQAGYGATNRLNELLGLGPQYDTSFENFNAAKYLAANPDAQAFVKTQTGPASIRMFGQDIRNQNAPSKSVEQLAYEHYTSDAARRGQARTGDFFRNQAPAADYGKYASDFSMKDFQADPGYAFRLAEGQKTLDRQAAARGGLISGGALKAAARYGQEMGSQEFTNAYNRYQTNRANQLNPLQSMAGMGQTTSTQLGQAGQNYATGAGEALTSGAAARASGYVGQANALTGALGTGLNFYQNQQYLNKLGSTPSGYGVNVPIGANQYTG